MKPTVNLNHPRLKNAFRQAHADKAAVDESGGELAGPRWEISVMRQIRVLDPLKSKPAFFELLEPMVWRLAPVTAALIIALATMLFQMNFSADVEMTALAMNDPVAFSIIEPLGN